MFFEPVIETEDKSFYADSLSRLTGESRSLFGALSIEELRMIYHRLFRRIEAARIWKGESQ